MKPKPKIELNHLKTLIALTGLIAATSALIMASLPARAEPLYPTKHRRLPNVEFSSEKQLTGWIRLLNSASQVLDFGSLPDGTLPGADGKPLEVSILTETQAFALFDELSHLQTLDFNVIRDGCYARAHEMAQILDSKQVVSAKVFVTGDLKARSVTEPTGYAYWRYHVAPVVLVLNENRPHDKQPKAALRAWVFDPGLFDRPTPIQDWIDALSIENPYDKTERPFFSFNTRFRYSINDPDPIDHYRDEDLLHQRETLAKLKHH